MPLFQSAVDKMTYLSQKGLQIINETIIGCTLKKDLISVKIPLFSSTLITSAP